MKKKKNVLFYSMSLGGAGAQRQMVNIIDSLGDRIFNITIFIRHNDTRFIDDRVFNFKIIPFRNDRAKRPFRLDVLFEIISLLKIVLKYKIDIIYARGYSFYWKASIVKIIFRRVKLISVESNFFSQNIYTKSNFMKFLLQKLCNFALLNSNLIYCLTKASKDDLLSILKIPEENVKIFPVVFDVEQFDNIPVKETVLNDNFFNITCMGRFGRQKNHTFLIDAFSRLERDDCRLHIFGEGEMKDDYIRKIRQLNLTRKVLIHTFTSSPYSILKQSDLIVFPSLYEGFGNVLLESIFCETPIISTNFFGIDQRIKDLLAEIGLIVELEDIDGLASKISYVMNNYSIVKPKIIKLKGLLVKEYSLSKYVKLLENHLSHL